MDTAIVTDIKAQEEAAYSNCGDKPIVELSAAQKVVTSLRDSIGDSDSLSIVRNEIHQGGHFDLRSLTNPKAIVLDLHNGLNEFANEAAKAISSNDSSTQASISERDALDAALTLRLTTIALSQTGQTANPESLNRFWQLLKTIQDSESRGLLFANVMTALKDVDQKINPGKYPEANKIMVSAFQQESASLSLDSPSAFRRWFIQCLPNGYYDSLSQFYNKMLRSGAQREVDVALNSIANVVKYLNQHPEAKRPDSLKNYLDSLVCLRDHGNQHCSFNALNSEAKLGTSPQGNKETLLEKTQRLIIEISKLTE